MHKQSFKIAELVSLEKVVLWWLVFLLQVACFCVHVHPIRIITHASLSKNKQVTVCKPKLLRSLIKCVQEIILFIIQTNGGVFKHENLLLVLIDVCLCFLHFFSKKFQKKSKKIHFRKELVRFGSLYICSTCAKIDFQN